MCGGFTTYNERLRPQATSGSCVSPPLRGPAFQAPVMAPSLPRLSARSTTMIPAGWAVRSMIERAIVLQHDIQDTSQCLLGLMVQAMLAPTGGPHTLKAPAKSRGASVGAMSREGGSRRLTRGGASPMLTCATMLSLRSPGSTRAIAAVRIARGLRLSCLPPKLSCALSAPPLSRIWLARFQLGCW